MISIIRGSTSNTRRVLESLWSTRRYYSSRNYQIFQENSLKSLAQDLSNSIQDIQSPDNIKLREVMNLLRFYQSDESQWSKYALREADTNYTRNLVTKIKNQSSLLVYVWEPGKASKIHSHPGTHCFMKTLKGQLQEHLYERDSENILKRSTTLPKNTVAYINGSMGLHRLKNPTTDIAISLHLFVPKFKEENAVINIVETQSENLDFYSIDGETVQK